MHLSHAKRAVTHFTTSARAILTRCASPETSDARARIAALSAAIGPWNSPLPPTVKLFRLYFDFVELARVMPPHSVEASVLYLVGRVLRLLAVTPTVEGALYEVLEAHGELLEAARPAIRDFERFERARLKPLAELAPMAVRTTTSWR